jgi:hypothetical protein
MNKFWRAFTSSKTPWILLFCVIFGVAGTVVWNSLRDDHASKRWKHVGKGKDEPAFLEFLSKPGFAWRKARVAVYSAAISRPPHEHSTLRDLGDLSLAHAIDLLAKKPKSDSWAELQKALAGTNDAAVEPRDPFRFDRSLVATVTKGVDWELGDRMVWTRVLVQPINFEFAVYTVPQTVNEKIKVASVEATNTRKLSANLGLTGPALEGARRISAPAASIRKRLPLRSTRHTRILA